MEKTDLAYWDVLAREEVLIPNDQLVRYIDQSSATDAAGAQPALADNDDAVAGSDFP